MFKRSKKGVIEEVPTQTIGLILALFFVILSTVVIVGFIKYFSGPPDQGTINTYNRMYSSIEAMMNPANKNESCVLHPAYIEPDYAIVGFNKKGTVRGIVTPGSEKEHEDDWTYTEEHCGAIKNNVDRPTACLEQACLCVCNGGAGDISGDDCKSEATCKRFGNHVKQLFANIEKGGVIGSSQTMTFDLVIYGEGCSGADKNVIVGYLLKKTSDSIYVEEIKTSKELQQLQAGKPDCEKLSQGFTTTGGQQTSAEAKPSGEVLQENINEERQKRGIGSP